MRSQAMNDQNPPHNFIQTGLRNVCTSVQGNYVRPAVTVLFILFLVFWFQSSYGQFKQIRGYVTDQFNNPLPKVAITNQTNYPLGESNSRGEFVFNYQIPMRGAVPVFNFDKEGYEPTYWQYNKEEDHVHITLYKFIKLIYTPIEGIVTDENGKPLSNVKIYSRSHNIKGNYSSTLSNEKGKFEFQYPMNTEKPIKIKFYKKGYRSYYWQYDDKNILEIVLESIPVPSK